jgi:hypothetical protein
MKIEEEYIEYILKNYPNLECDIKNNFIIGNISFYREYKGHSIEDEYNIKIDFNNIPKNSILPKVFITDNKIEKIAQNLYVDKKDLHLNDDNSFCLILDLREKEYFPNNFNINKFFEELLEPYLFWVSYYKRYKKPPWQGYEHGELAYLEWCIENKIDFRKTAGHHNCFCGSNIKIKKCHPLLLKAIYEIKKIYNYSCKHNVKIEKCYISIFEKFKK